VNAGSNYVFTFVDGSLTIAQRSVVVTPNAQAKIYGNADPVLGYSTSSLGSGASLTGSLARVAGENAGSYAINRGSISDAGNPNYQLTFLPNALAINPRPLTVSANDATKFQGDANPQFSLSASGFAPGEDLRNLSGLALLTTLASDASPIGRYLITPAGLSSSNYAITFVNGVLSVILKIVNPFSGHIDLSEAALSSAKREAFCVRATVWPLRWTWPDGQYECAP
jgi:hypothetical protein